MWYGNPALSMKAPLTMEQIDAAMRQSIEDKPLLSPATRAYEAIIPSVVRVIGLMTEGDDGSDDKERGVVERGVGSGVVIIDNGTILTNLHVVSGAKRIRVTFYGRHRSPTRSSSTPSRRTTWRCCGRAPSPTTSSRRRCARPPTSPPATR